MRGYLSFVLVLFSLVLIISLLQFNSYTSTKHIVTERIYLVSMNAKEVSVELLRQGALKGFVLYDSTHSLESCMHCPPCHPEFCNPVKCQECFREDEARAAARDMALAHFSQLATYSFDSDFSVALGAADVQVFTKADSVSRNGFSLHSLRIMQDIPISISSEKFSTRGTAKIPGGLIVNVSVS
jgi:hypothetical protein